MTKYSGNYEKYFGGEFLMGPNSVYLLDELIIRHPLELDKDDIVLDLGCGKGLTSLFLAEVTGASVYANDLWTRKYENEQRFKDWNIDGRVTPFQEDAESLSFENETFSAVVSVDAYHYFAGKKGFLEEKILPLVKPGGTVLIAVPGIKSKYEGRQDELLSGWLGDESILFRSGSWWKYIIGSPADAASINIWEMENFAPAWESWLSVDSSFAVKDKECFDTIINKYTCFIGIEVIKK